MSKLEKYLAKAKDEAARKTMTVEIDGEVWSVRSLTLTELRTCERMADKGEEFDWYRYNDARIVKATEHEFQWNNQDLQKAYKAVDKYDLPAKLFDHDMEGYAKLLNAIREISQEQSEEELVEEAKN
ncbi:phage tail assembly chaperone [Brevibacillus sp. SYSU BS000544]|uniref:phage tail assembly chaperone n=1 Tax=Brevibacillus sp. SYSU BS000544 TaxID=3416443 RepID=UPI003CE48A80